METVIALIEHGARQRHPPRRAATDARPRLIPRLLLRPGPRRASRAHVSGRPSDGTPTSNGAQAPFRTPVDAGVTTCFTNPGTSEMHFVSALDTVPQMRAILTLFEGVATGAADGYARMTDRPAATLLHLGPGWATRSQTFTTREKPRCPSSTSSAITRPITSPSTRSCIRTSKPWHATSLPGCGPPRPPRNSAATPSRRSPRRTGPRASWRH